MKNTDEITIKCAACQKEYKLIYDDGEPQTLFVRYAESCGIYGVEVRCPHCAHETSVQ